jgi:hypothetical protein
MVRIDFTPRHGPWYTTSIPTWIEEAMPIAVLLLTLLSQAPPFREFVIQFEFERVRTFRCQLGDGEGRLYTSDRTENRRGDKVIGEGVIDQVNDSERVARVVGVAGGDPAAILDGSMAASFFQTTPFGGVTITTVFKAPIQPSVYRAAMTRHLPLATGDVNVTQLYGTCRGLN